MNQDLFFSESNFSESQLNGTYFGGITSTDNKSTFAGIYWPSLPDCKPITLLDTFLEPSNFNYKVSQSCGLDDRIIGEPEFIGNVEVIESSDFQNLGLNNQSFITSNNTLNKITSKKPITKKPTSKKPISKKLTSNKLSFRVVNNKRSVAKIPGPILTNLNNDNRLQSISEKQLSDINGAILDISGTDGIYINTNKTTKIIKEVSAKRTIFDKRCCWCRNIGKYAYPGNISIRSCEMHLNESMRNEMFLIDTLICNIETISSNKKSSNVCNNIKQYYRADDPSKTPICCDKHPSSVKRLYRANVLKLYETCNIGNFIARHNIH